MRVIYYIAVVSGEWTALWLLHPTYKPIYRAIYRFGDGREASVFLHRNSRLTPYLCQEQIELILVDESILIVVNRVYHAV